VNRGRVSTKTVPLNSGFRDLGVGGVAGLLTRIGGNGHPVGA
jgi:hypothetical protein